MAENDGIIKFSPVFTDYKLSKGQFLLFGNGVFIDPSRYEVVDNSTIKLLLPEDIARSRYIGFTMAIIKEQEKEETYGNFIGDNLDYIFTVKKVVATEDKQKKFKVPSIGVEDPQFMVFVGSVSMEMKDEYTYNKSAGLINFNEDDFYVAKGRSVYFVFFNKNTVPSSGVNDYLKLVPMRFSVHDYPVLKIPASLSHNIIFNKDNLIIFVNGIYLEPDRFSLEKNKFIILNEADDEIQNDTAITAFYLSKKKSVSDNNIEGPYSYLDMKEDHDYVWFDEMYSRPYSSKAPISYDMNLLNGYLNYIKEIIRNKQSTDFYGDVELVIRKEITSDFNGDVTFKPTGNISKLMDGTVKMEVEYLRVSPDSDTIITSSNPFDKYDSNGKFILIDKKADNIKTYESGTYRLSIFDSCQYMKSVTFEEGSAMKTIPSYAFRACSELEAVMLTEGVEVIKEHAFGDCINIHYLNIPKSTLTIESNAFDSASLRTIIMPDSELKFYEDSFSFDDWDTVMIQYDTTSPSYLFDNSKLARDKYAQSDTNKISYKDPLWTSTCTRILPYQFYDFYGIYSIEIPDTVTRISEFAIANCYQLQTVSLPAHLKTIDSYAFEDNTSMTIDRLPNTLTSIGDEAFKNCSSLKDQTSSDKNIITIPASVESIGDEAFKGCSSLDNIVMNNGLKTIGDRICDSSNITELYIPTSVESIGLNAFTELVNLKKITVDKPSQSLDGAPWGAPNAEVKWILQNT